jgi:hypothetical protein
VIEKESPMVIFTPRPERSGDILPQAVGVFEDDTLLLRLASRARFADSEYLRAASGPIDADDRAIEVARLANAEAWEI